MNDQDWEEYADRCYECTGYGDDYRYDEETDSLVSNCLDCPFFPKDEDD